jgi:hypothetical protein
MGTSLKIMTSAPQVPIDYNMQSLEQLMPENQIKGIEPFQQSQRSGLSLFMQNS